MGINGFSLQHSLYFQEGQFKFKTKIWGGGGQSQITYFVTSIWILIRMVFFG